LRIIFCLLHHFVEQRVTAPEAPAFKPGEEGAAISFLSAELWYLKNMKRCNIVRVLFSKEQAKVLETLGDRCAALWNAVQYRCRQAFFRGKPMPSYEALCSEFKEHPAYKALPADVAQEVIKKARKAWDSFFACLRLFRKGELERPPRVPGY